MVMHMKAYNPFISPVLFSRRLTIFIIALFCLAFSQNSTAATCNFDQMNGNLMDFGILSAAQSSPVFDSATLQFTCTADGLLPTVSYSVAISAGSSGDFNQRTMRFAAWSISYNLFIDPTFITVFGDGMPGNNSQTVSGLCVSGVTCIVPVYGKLDGGQSLRAGQYSDAVTITLSF